MFEIVPSQWMKKYFEEVGFEICMKICRSMSGKEFI